MVRQNQRRGAGDFEPLFHIGHACGVEFVDFAEQCFGREHHARADKAVQLFMQNAAGNQAQYGFFAVHHQRVPRVVPALKANHARGLLRQPVHNFAFAFVAPLCADNNYVLCHF